MMVPCLGGGGSLHHHKLRMFIKGNHLAIWRGETGIFFIPSHMIGCAVNKMGDIMSNHIQNTACI